METGSVRIASPEAIDQPEDCTPHERGQFVSVTEQASEVILRVDPAVRASRGTTFAPRSP